MPSILPDDVRAALAQIVEPITRETSITPYTKLTQRTLLANFSTGMMNGVNAFTPLIASHLIDPRDTRIDQLRSLGAKFLLHDFKIARNLQHTAETIVEPLLDKYSNDLSIYLSYLNPLHMQRIGNPASKHFTGEALNIFLRSTQDNMFLEAENILDAIKGQYTRAVLMFNGASWMHITNDGPFSLRREGTSNPKVMTMDMKTGISANGIQPLRGAAQSPWYVPEYSPYRRLKTYVQSLE